MRRCFLAALVVLGAVQALPAKDALPQQTYANRKVTLRTLRNRAARLTDGALLALTDPDKPIENAAIEIASEDAWVVLPKVRPSMVASRDLKLVTPRGGREHPKLAPFGLQRRPVGVPAGR